jgi:hypothetical protein
MVPRFGGNGGGNGQPALRIESYNHGGIFPLPFDSVNPLRPNTTILPLTSQDLIDYEDLTSTKRAYRSRR